MTYSKIVIETDVVDIISQISYDSGRLDDI